jgi:hypothetical protein
MLRAGCEDLSFSRPATFARTSTAFPIQADTLVAVAGFVPIGLNDSTADEHCCLLFAVIAADLPNDCRAGRAAARREANRPVLSPAS